MGCCGSKSKPASQQQKDELFREVCKVMMVSSATEALKGDDFSSIEIDAPTAKLDSLRKTAQNLREASKEAKENWEKKEEGAKGKISALVNSGKGGIMGTLLGKAADVAGKVIEGASDLAGAASEKVLGGMAETLETQLAFLDGKFSVLGTELVAKNKSVILDIYNAGIPTAKFENAEKLVRSKGPLADHPDWGETDRVTKSFHVPTEGGGALEEMTKKMLPIVKEHVQESGIVKSMDMCFDAARSANEKLGEVEFLAKYKQEPAGETDIDQYLAEQVLLALAKMMGAKEAEYRIASTVSENVEAALEGAQGSAKLVMLCLSSMEITEAHYYEFKKSEA